MRKTLYFLTAVFLLSIVPLVFAKDGGGDNREGSNHSEDRQVVVQTDNSGKDNSEHRGEGQSKARVRVEVKQEDQADNNQAKVEVKQEDEVNQENQVEPQKVENEAREAENENEVEVEEVEASPSPSATPQQAIKVEDNNFEINGQITDISGNTLTISGQTVNLDLSKVSKFIQNGILAPGKTVKIEGIISDGTKLAKKITVFGPRVNQAEVENVRNRAEVKVKGPLDQVNLILQEILNSLRSLIS